MEPDSGYDSCYKGILFNCMHYPGTDARETNAREYALMSYIHGR